MIVFLHNEAVQMTPKHKETAASPIGSCIRFLTVVMKKHRTSLWTLPLLNVTSTACFWKESCNSIFKADIERWEGTPYPSLQPLITYLDNSDSTVSRTTFTPFSQSS